MAIILKDNVKLLIEIAAKVGGVSWELANEMGAKYKRLKQLEEADYIEKQEFFIKEDDEIKTRYVYTVSSEGETYLKNESICTQIEQLNGYEHTIAAERVYLDLREQYNAREILNEREQRNYFKEELDYMKNNNIEYSVCDFCIITEDCAEAEFIEVVTQNYRKSDFVKKENYCQQFHKTPNYK